MEQGDIFALDLVTPLASQSQYIFRTRDGQHGHAVFEGRGEGYVFEREELEQLLARIDRPSRTENHTPPFALAPNGDPEMVIAHAHLRRYFTIATQTCDVSGLDKQPLAAAIILPIQTLLEICLTTRLEFVSEDRKMTIHEFLCKHCPDTGLLSTLPPAQYGRVLRQTITDWTPSPKKLLGDRNRVANLLKKMLQSKTSVYYLRENDAFGLPESIIDFTAAYTVHRDILIENTTSRVARIASPTREDFSHKFAHFISRVAIPAPSGPAGFL